MISILWLIPAIFVGVFIGLLIFALLSANDPKPNRPPKWWDNDGNV